MLGFNILDLQHSDSIKQKHKAPLNLLSAFFLDKRRRVFMMIAGRRDTY